MDGGTSSAWRRLNAALFKLEQVLASIDRIADASFPHGDAEEALKKIRGYFEDKRKSIRSVPRGEDVAVEDLQEYLREARDEVKRYTKWLGIILRSTNLRNSFEIYHPLKRLAQKSVSKDTHLIISSEWEFTPFTYPMNLSTLPNFIIVGTPATESQNLLIIPLAGHEIGHSVWKSLGDRPKFELKLNNIAKTFVKNNKGLFPDADKRRIELVITPRIATHLISKAEEIFCDFVGLHMFGEAYFYAFEYFLAPGVNHSTQEYPPSIQRLRSLEEYARAVGLRVPDGVIETWNHDEEPVSDKPTPFEIADKVLEKCLEDIVKLCKKTLDEREIKIPSDHMIENIEKAFNRGEPYNKKAKLSETINALWRVTQKRNVTKRKEIEATFIDIEIALKTIEVAEYCSRLEE